MVLIFRVFVFYYQLLYKCTSLLFTDIFYNRRTVELSRRSVARDLPFLQRV
jgi:hypothetical protein